MEPRFIFIQFEDFMGKGNQDDIEVNEGMDIYIYIFVIFSVPHPESWDEQQQTATTHPQAAIVLVSLRTWAPGVF